VRLTHPPFRAIKHGQLHELGSWLAGCWQSNKPKEPAAEPPLGAVVRSISGTCVNHPRYVCTLVLMETVSMQFSSTGWRMSRASASDFQDPLARPPLHARPRRTVHLSAIFGCPDIVRLPHPARGYRLSSALSVPPWVGGVPGSREGRTADLWSTSRTSRGPSEDVFHWARTTAWAVFKLRSLHVYISVFCNITRCLDGR
jgi:hypothetical protein